MARRSARPEPGPGRGTVTRTGLLVLSSKGPVSFVAGPHEVIVRPWDNVTGCAVPDGGTRTG